MNNTDNFINVFRYTNPKNKSRIQILYNKKHDYFSVEVAENILDYQVSSIVTIAGNKWRDFLFNQIQELYHQ